MADKGTIVFTVTAVRRGEDGVTTLRVYSKHPRGCEENVDSLAQPFLYSTMVDISEVLNDEGYAVIFEAD